MVTLFPYATLFRSKKIGVGGGPLDKSWLLLRGLTQRRHGVDPAVASEPVVGAPPLLTQKVETGEIDAVLNYWHYSARLEAKGFRRIVGANDASMALGAAGPISAIGYVFCEEWAARILVAARGFSAAYPQAKSLLPRAVDGGEGLSESTGATEETH